MKFLYLLFIPSLLLLGICSCKKSSDDPARQGITYGIVGVEPAMARSGDTISIYGAGFQPSADGNKLLINGADAPIISATGSVLRVVVPDAARTGVISVTTGSHSFSFAQPFHIVTTLSGNLSADLTLAPDKIYLLKGEVHVTSGATMTIPAGTTILGNKTTLGALVIDDGAALIVNGTVDNPVVFTSDQPVTQRLPGDWTGITLAASTAASKDMLRYVRIEFAGFHQPDVPGAALLVNRSVGAGKIAYVEASYSAGDGFRSAAVPGTTTYLGYLVAFGCAGTDFDFAGDSRVIAQFLLGLKDPVYADQYSADGLWAQSARVTTISNLTLVGPNGISRKANSNAANYNSGFNYDGVLNRHAGRGVHIGGYDRVSGNDLGGTLQLFNSLIAAPWLAAISVDGPRAWNNYGNNGSVIRHTSITYNIASIRNTLSHQDAPQRGYSFSAENLADAYQGFSLTQGTPQYTDFNNTNDTALLQQEVPFLQAPSPYTTYDDLGILNLVLYTKLHAPIMSPIPESSLMTGADFTYSALSDPFVDKTSTFRGAFGATDWTRSWSNYTPQETSYN